MLNVFKTAHTIKGPGGGWINTNQFINDAGKLQGLTHEELQALGYPKTVYSYHITGENIRIEMGQLEFERFCAACNALLK